MVESPKRIWIEADDECPYFYEAHELHDVEQDVIEYVRADLHAALKAKLAALAAENERLKQEIAATQEKLIRANDELIQRNSTALSHSEMEALKRIRDTAMEHTLVARIPECGAFAGIAQDADWLLSELTAAMEAGQ